MLLMVFFSQRQQSNPRSEPILRFIKHLCWGVLALYLGIPFSSLQAGALCVSLGSACENTERVESEPIQQDIDSLYFDFILAVRQQPYHLAPSSKVVFNDGPFNQPLQTLVGGGMTSRDSNSQTIAYHLDLNKYLELSLTGYQLQINDRGGAGKSLIKINLYRGKRRRQKTYFSLGFNLPTGSMDLGYSQAYGMVVGFGFEKQYSWGQWAHTAKYSSTSEDHTKYKRGESWSYSGGFKINQEQIQPFALLTAVGVTFDEINGEKITPYDGETFEKYASDITVGATLPELYMNFGLAIPLTTSLPYNQERYMRFNLGVLYEF